MTSCCCPRTALLQVNNEPSLLFQVKLLCEVVADNIGQGKTPLLQ
jgi:hypothetical protein